MKDALYSGVWGTIGPRFEEACTLIAQRCTARHCVLTHSHTTAYEITLRSLLVSRGDHVLCSIYSAPMNAEIAMALCALPVFVDVGKYSLLPTPNSVDEALYRDARIKAVVLDYDEQLDLPGIVQVCTRHDRPLILNAAGALDASFSQEGLYAAVYDLMGCGAAVTQQESVYRMLFACHHCGNTPGTGASIAEKAVVGGDMRITEFQALDAMDYLRSSHPATPISQRRCIPAYENPALRSAYFCKMTGADTFCWKDDYPHLLAQLK